MRHGCSSLLLVKPILVLFRVAQPHTGRRSSWHGEPAPLQRKRGCVIEGGTVVAPGGLASRRASRCARRRRADRWLVSPMVRRTRCLALPPGGEGRLPWRSAVSSPKVSCCTPAARARCRAASWARSARLPADAPGRRRAAGPRMLSLSASLARTGAGARHQGVRGRLAWGVAGQHARAPAPSLAVTSLRAGLRRCNPSRARTASWAERQASRCPGGRRSLMPAGSPPRG